MIHHFNKSLNDKHVSELIMELDKINKEDGQHTLYFTSCGGDSCSTELLLYYLNTQCLDWKLIGHSELYSNGFDIVVRFKGTKKILSDTIIMLHIKSFTVHMRELKNSNSTLQRAQDDLDYSNKKYIKLLKKIGVPKKYIKSVVSGKDIYLYELDIKKLKI